MAASFPIVCILPIFRHRNYIITSYSINKTSQGKKAMPGKIRVEVELKKYSRYDM